MSFFVYMLRCAEGSFYVGSTDDIDHRIAQHHAGTTGGFTASRRPIEVVYLEEHVSRDDARVREHQLKGWSRAKKRALVAGDWRRVVELARSRTQRHPSTSSG